MDSYETEIIVAGRVPPVERWYRQNAGILCQRRMLVFDVESQLVAMIQRQ